MLPLQIYRTGTLLVSTITLVSLAVRNSQAQPSTASTAPQYSIDSTAPWNPAEWRGRLVVGEYGTAVYCGLCQADDDMYNKLLQRYPRTAFISLAYHIGLGLPITDLTETPDLLTRMRGWYGWPEKERPGQVIEKPEFFNNWMDGTVELGRWIPEEKVHETGVRLVKTVDAELKRPPEAFLHVQTKVDGGRIVASVKVDSVIGKHPKAYLRLLVVEDTVNLLSDGQYEQRPNVAQLPRQVQHMVVRAVAHTDKLSLGLPLKVHGTVKYTFDMAKIQDRFVGYHKFGIDKMTPWYIGGKVSVWDPHTKKGTEEQLAKFPDERDWRMDPLRLHVVALVQDAQTAEVLQAVMVKLDPAQAKRLLPAKVQPTLILKTQSDSTLASYWGYKELND